VSTTDGSMKPATRYSLEGLKEILKNIGGSAGLLSRVSCRTLDLELTTSEQWNSGGAI
jgi:hypothetical protein